MTKREALQKFISHIDVASVRADFPKIDWDVSELEDGQQEIVIRLQGLDPGFRPSADIAAIEAMTVDDVVDFPVKCETTLIKQKRNRTRARLRLRDLALMKRFKCLLGAMGLSLNEGHKIISEACASEKATLIRGSK